MRCRRCSHDLKPRADRCLRCFALNPENVPGPLFAGLDSDPPKDVRVRFDDEPSAAAADRFPIPPPPPPRAPARRSPPPVEPAPLPFEGLRSAAPPRGARPAPVPQRQELAPAPAPPAAPLPPAPRGLLRARLLAWSVDLAIVALAAALHVALAVLVLGPRHLAPGRRGSLDYWIDLLRGGGVGWLWLLLALLIAVAYSTLFAALWGRTPGLGLAGLRLCGRNGAPLPLPRALAHAALALPSAALGLSGFALALPDPEARTLHDRLCGAFVRPRAIPLASGVASP